MSGYCKDCGCNPCYCEEEALEAQQELVNYRREKWWEAFLVAWRYAGCTDDAEQLDIIRTRTDAALAAFEKRLGDG